jgi:hypothetical protein
MWPCFRFSLSARRGSERERPPELGVESIFSGQRGKGGRLELRRGELDRGVGRRVGPARRNDADRWEWNVVRVKMCSDGLEIRTLADCDSVLMLSVAPKRKGDERWGLVFTLHV